MKYYSLNVVFLICLGNGIYEIVCVCYLLK